MTIQILFKTYDKDVLNAKFIPGVVELKELDDRWYFTGGSMSFYYLKKDIIGVPEIVAGDIEK